MKILIVDDEPLARIGMRTILPWETYGHCVIGEASCVDEALSIGRRERPDIVLVDIIMPEKDGFELISRLRMELPACKFVIVSCKSSIEYFRRAMRLDVVDYIQKSTIQADELLEVVERVAEKIRKEWVFEENDGTARPGGSGSLAAFLIEIVKGHVSDGNLIRQRLENLLMRLTSNKAYMLILQTRNTGDLGKHIRQAINICQEIINDTGTGVAFQDGEGSIAALVCLQESNAGSGVIALCNRIRETLAQLFDVDSVTGVSLSFFDPEMIGQAYGQAREALEEFFFNIRDSVFLYTPILEDRDETLEQIEKAKQIIFSIQASADLHTIVPIVKSITRDFSVAKGLKPDHAKRVYLEIAYHVIEILRKENIHDQDSRQFNPLEFIEGARSIYDLESSLSGFIEHVRKGALAKHAGRGTEIISKIQKFISEHIDERVSLSDVADHACLSPVYVCRLFKQETGENIMAYAHKVKVDKAKELLSKGVPVWEICERLRFSSESYFIKVFKRYTGSTPFKYVRKNN